MTHLFTPRMPDGSRLKLQIDDGDRHRVNKHLRTLGWKIPITDQTTGKKYVVMGADCSLPNCRCDAVVIAETLEDPLKK